MAPPFKRLSIAEFRHLVATREWRSAKSEIHVHHTWRPRGNDFVGEATIRSMYQFHVNERHFSDIAQHISIDPSGYIWTGRPWDASPASAIGHNSRRVFMFETIGDFDRGQERLEGVQLYAIFSVIDAISDRFGLTSSAIRFHNEMSSKSCPGSSIDKPEFVRQVEAFRSAKGFDQFEFAPKANTPLPDPALVDAEDLSRFDADEDKEHPLE